MALRAEAGKYERLFYERCERDRKRWPATSQAECEPDGFWFDVEQAERPVIFCEQYCHHHKGEWAGERFILQDWQKDLRRELFGWRDRAGNRRFREAYAEIPRKNGKSQEGAATGNYLLLADKEPGAEVYSAATKREQARIVFDAAREMAKKSPALRHQLGNGKGIGKYNLHRESTASKFEPLGADFNTLDGLNPHGVIIDELHAHRDRGVYDVLKTALGSRRQPLLFNITTAGVYDPTTIGWELHDFAVKVLEGVIEAEWFFAVIYAADQDDDWKDPAVWRKANPNLGISVKEEYIKAQCDKAKASPSFENTFRRLHLNQWTEQVTRWLSMDDWKACPKRAPEPELAGRRGWAGLDLASKLDIAAYVLVLPDGDDYDLVCRFWVPEGAVAKAEKAGRVPYSAWVRDGWLEATPGDAIDYAFIEAEVIGLTEAYEIPMIGYDPWNAEYSRQRLEDEGLELVEMRQGVATLGEPTKELERLVTTKRLRHGNHPVLTWMASNVSVREDSNGNFKPDREKSPGKIDGIVATIMGLGLAMRFYEASSDGQYVTWLDG